VGVTFTYFAKSISIFLQNIKKCIVKKFDFGYANTC
jgi:hypothetical protein